ncbi:hypothetical protein [Chamaesiphon sp. GL140_3_metabinner_50]|uniref:hypothetical protein n=1 Tax=Chamaesiphon sp. GL140_3_metabinner_50 TaxID=2970812 RepID=UPI0025D25127|nr:hypothetical protein [Chamaesiphon sp. GL140_3_metabinner_50]
MSTAQYHQNFTQESLELEPIHEYAEPITQTRSTSITVGELFLQVKWQLPESSEPVTKIQAHDVSRN